MYVSFDYYQERYGNKVPEVEFNRAEAKAESIIRYLTFQNGDIFAKENDMVKMAVCAATETVYKQSTMANSAGIKSENNDGYSVQFVTENSDGQTAEAFLMRKVYDSIVIHLAPTGWLTRAMR